MLGPANDVPPPSEELTSALLRRVLAGLTVEDVRIGQFVRELRWRS